MVQNTSEIWSAHRDGLTVENRRMRERVMSGSWFLSLIFALGIMLPVIILSGCGSNSGKSLGQPIPKDANIVSLAAVINSPAEYNGKTFVMEGFITGQCASLCEFFFKDGVHRATIFPLGFEFPKLPIGNKVTVYVTATSGEEQVIFSALGLELE